MSKKFDYLFVGLGASNCLLILRLHENGMLKGKTIAIIEPSNKNTNDKTFCIWASEEELFRLKLETLVCKSWDEVEIGGIAKQNINPLRYYYVKSIDLYNITKNVLNEYELSLYNTSLTENPTIIDGLFEINLNDSIIYVEKVFDSRPPNFLVPQKAQSHLFQSFYGWKIKTTNDFFDINSMMMMDFRVEQNNATQFIYILPFTTNYALIEVTRFGNTLLKKEDALPIFNDYVNKLGITFEIIETEQGIIPMSTAKMETKDFGTNWINMGANANLLKATTGYAFHAMANDAINIAENLKKNCSLERATKKQRFEFYDRLLLKILNDQPEWGKPIFETLFSKVPMVNVLNFMSEKTTFSQEVSIFIKLPKRVFIKTAIFDVVEQVKKIPVLILPFIFTFLTLFLTYFKLETISWLFIGLGFCSVGLFHGALDHLTQKINPNKKEYTYFIANYLLKSAFIGLVWYIVPTLALLIFIMYSAWHFGQADYKEWNLQNGPQSLLWGLITLTIILIFHFKELNLVLVQIPNFPVDNFINNISQNQLYTTQIITVAAGFTLAILNKSKLMILTLIYLLLSAMLPLLISFGIYFVGQHSMHGWKHLKQGLNEKSSNLILKALPFSVGGLVIILFFTLFAGVNYLGIFFIVLSCLSMPHVWSMHYFYHKQKANS